MATLSGEALAAAGGTNPALHIPDGFLSTPVAAAGYLVAGVVIAVAVRKADHQLGERAVPLMGILAAFIFAAQMMNFPVAGGTSGHMLGATLAAVLLGPWAALLIMTTVVGIQALVFQDGGIAVMGANIVNMGAVAVVTGYATYRLLGAMLPGTTGRGIAAFAGAWVSVEASALTTGLMLVASDTSPFDVVMPAMLGVHALIGIGEGLITAAALGFIAATRPDLLRALRPAAAYRG